MHTHRGRTSVRQTKSNPSGTKERIILTQVLLQSQQATFKPSSYSDTEALWSTGCPGNAKRSYQKTKEGGKERKEKVDMENPDCVVECDGAGGRWRGHPQGDGGQGQEERRTARRCNEEVDDKHPQQYLRTKLVVSELPQKA